VETGKSKIDRDLTQALDTLTDQEEIDVLLYPKERDEGLRELLRSKQKGGVLEYNILEIANCIVVRAPKKIILELAVRNDVSRLAMNPKFTVQ